MDSNIINSASRRSALRLIRCDHRPSYFPAALPLVATCLVLTSILLVLVGPAAAQVDPDKIESIAQDPKLPWELEADRVEYDQTIDEYTATGNVLIYKKNIRLSADFVRFDHKNMKAYAEGNVLLTNGEDILSGTSMEMDLENQIGSVENGYLFLKENNFHLTGNLIKKVGEKTYTIDEASLTTCDGENPDWRITGKKVKIKEDGEGTALHATLWARKMPVMSTASVKYLAWANPFCPVVASITSKT